ncbi:uncharacterized protein EDB91DRAFT_36987 [Suillus paluster]|uniref:uncharacterized protein n=1 Tax=Suillus paluster TaxID=48578 RepID=UPI001B874A11|nr:uncharacterized protein EDB91DRAFT_36987 [Suillus paluster]KAG1756809.1 hypothetical protein EDB91DRAFT_36987 [Suillus paluster]
MSWLRGITSAVLSSTAKGGFSPRPKLPFRMLSDVRHPPAMLDRPKNQTHDRVWAKAIEETIERTAGTAQRAHTPTPDELWAQRSQSATFNPPADTYTGRRVFVTGDLGEAFRRLQTRLRRNRVTQEVSRQRRHEKKGVKRRRLSSERWRRMFANEVRKKVQLVSTIRRRGAY